MFSQYDTLPCAEHSGEVVIGVVHALRSILLVPVLGAFSSKVYASSLVCVHVCMLVYVCTCLHACICVYMSACLYMCVHVFCTHVCMCACVHVYVVVSGISILHRYIFVGDLWQSAIIATCGCLCVYVAARTTPVYQGTPCCLSTGVSNSTLHGKKSYFVRVLFSLSLSLSLSHSSKPTSKKFSCLPKVPPPCGKPE